MDKKRIIFAIIFLLVTILFGYLLYRVFFAKKIIPTTTVPTVTTPGIEGFPTAEEGGGITITTTTIPTGLPTAVTVPTTPTTRPTNQPEPAKIAVDSPISNATSDLTGESKFYNQTDGKFYRLNKDGQVEAMSDKVFFNVQNVIWSPVKNESIMEYPDGSNIYYNFDTQKQASLPKHWENFSFSNLGDKIAAKSISLAPENRWLVTADPDGKNITAIEPLGDYQDQVIVDWSPNKQIVAFSTTGEPLGDDRQQVLLVGLHGENYQALVVEGRGFQPSWSKTGTKLLYSIYSARNDFKPELWVVNSSVDKIGTDRKLLGVNTWAEKCTFSDDRFVYCGVPVELRSGAGFVPKVADYTPDDIYKIDIQTGIKTIIPTDNSHVIETIFLSEDGKTLYFTDKNKIGLFNIPL